MTVCSVSRANRKALCCCDVPLSSSVSEGVSLFGLHRSQFPAVGLDGRVCKKLGLSQRLEKSSSPDSNHSEAHESLLMLQIRASVFLFLPDLGGVIMAATLRWPGGPELLMSLSPSLSPPITPGLYAVFVLVLLFEAG